LTETIERADDLRAWIEAGKKKRKRIGFIPTMGALHDGHLALVDAARSRTDIVVMSIFVNPLQFAPHEDLARYPRDLDRDTDLASARGVHALFIPSVEMMYPPGGEIRVIPGETGARWEGKMRPGHFTGVLTVVAKLFHLVTPDVAVFGQKDIQQAVLVRRLIVDLNWNLELVIVPTVREPDGLALSSRNVYLDPESRARAGMLSASLYRAHQLFRAGERQAAVLQREMERVLQVHPDISVEYIAIVDPHHMRPVTVVEDTTIAALAARVGSTRLIDNIALGQGLR
jgi:pantoate--beta-alanine ligase